MAKVTKTQVPLENFLSNEEELEIVTLNVGEEETTWELKKMSWYEKNKCITKSTLLTPNADTGEMTFGFDLATYYAEALSIMIVSAPIPITPSTIKKLKDEIGSRLQTFVPAPLESAVEDIAKKD